MMRALAGAMLAVMVSAFPVHGKVRVIVLPADAATNGQVLLKHIAASVEVLAPDDQLLVYSARQPGIQIAAIGPRDRRMNDARAKVALSAQFKPVREYLSALPSGAAAEMPGNLMLPALMDELGRNLFPSLTDRTAHVLVLGSLLFWDRRDARSSLMAEGFVPSDGTLRAPAMEWPFSIIGASERMAGVTVHYCSLNSGEFVSSEHEAQVRRFWSLWTVGQGGRVGTFSSDTQTCFRRFNVGEASGQITYQMSRDLKPEMLRIVPREPATLPASFDAPGRYFLYDDMPISRTPPIFTKGIAWIGIKWQANCDLDLYTRGDPASPWLYYGSPKSAEGRFNKDYTSGTGEAQFEYVEFMREIDLTKAEAAVNLYACDAAAPPEAVVRVWFAGKVYQAPVRLGAKTGNRGATPIAPPYWVRLDLRKVVGLVGE
jgi:hypothetical protein